MSSLELEGSESFVGERRELESVVAQELSIFIIMSFARFICCLLMQKGKPQT